MEIKMPISPRLSSLMFLMMRKKRETPVKMMTKIKMFKIRLRITEMKLKLSQVKSSMRTKISV